MSRKFQRCTESFECLHCGSSVTGDGYTNHCPRCLWSRHVDVNPGDREEECGGPMEPIGIELTHGHPYLLHRCQHCGKTRRNKTAGNDDFEAVLALMRSPG